MAKIFPNTFHGKYLVDINAHSSPKLKNKIYSFLCFDFTIVFIENTDKHKITRICNPISNTCVASVSVKNKFFKSKELSTKDDGVAMYSLVMTRPTMPLSVLIEVAYMIHPDEYKLLLDENFRQKAAESVRDGLKQYLLNSVKTDGIN